MRCMLNCDKAVFESLNKYGIPEISPYEKNIDCDNWINFDNSIRKTNTKGLHFFEHDYKFERVWNNPDKYISILKRYEYVIQTDFSLYYDFPVAVQIYNKYRNHWLSAYYATKGINMIPNISLSSDKNYDWSFCGYPKKSVVAFSDVGAVKENESRKIIKSTYEEMIKRLEPKKVLYFTRSVKNAPNGCDIIVLKYIKD